MANTLSAPAKTDQEIGQILGLSRARVFQIRSRAMRKIREAILADPDLCDLAIAMGYQLAEQERQPLLKEEA